MKGNRAIVAAVVIVLLAIGGWWLFKRGSRGKAVDLVSTFQDARKQPDGGVFQVIDADVNGEKKRAIFTMPPSRITWKMRIPDDAWLKLSVATKPETWENEGDGVLFFVGVSDGRAFDQLFTLHVNPFTNKSERRWIPVTVDLSAYAGEEVEIVFNTRTSVGQADDPRHDTALWGAPEIVIR
jgi:hypothetical protein